MNAPVPTIDVLFLDIDGVMNNKKHCESWQPHTGQPVDMTNQTCFDPKSVAALAEILAKSKCQVVLSSTWRYYNTLAEMETFFELVGLKFKFLDHTSMQPKDLRRGHEIAEWLEAHPEVRNYVILDDDSDVAECEVVRDRWVKTSWFVGLQQEHVSQALKHLGVEA